MDVLRFVIVALRPTRAVAAENLFLRRQLAMYVERGVKPRRPDVATRVSLALLSRLFDWRTSVVVVRPETLIRWHRAGFRLLWRLKSRPGRPAIPGELRELIRRMAAENPLPTQQSRHRIAEGFVVLATSVLGGLHHEYSLAPAVV